MTNRLMDKNIIILLYCLSGCLLPVGIQANSDEQPDLEFLEFLAEWQSDQGEWIDPLQMQDLAQNEITAKPIEVLGDE